MNSHLNSRIGELVNGTAEQPNVESTPKALGIGDRLLNPIQGRKVAFTHRPMKSIIRFSQFFLVLQSCTKPEDCPWYFQLPMQIIPAKTEYSVGDTLVLISKFHRNVMALNYKKEPLRISDMKGIAWWPYAEVFRTDSMVGPDNTFFSVFADHFLYLRDTMCDFDLSQSPVAGTGLFGEYGFVEDSFYLSYKLVCIRPGSFVMRTGSFNERGGFYKQDFPAQCSKGGFDVIYEMNDGGENNISLLKDSPDPRWSTQALEDPKQWIHNYGGYCFKVVP